MTALTTKSDEIALVLEEAIVSGELAPGTVLRQEQLSEEFSVSRTPIREALRQLAALGLVEFVGKRGVQVRALSRSELHETFVVRAALEGFAAELASTRLTKAELRTLRAAERRFARLTHALRTAERSPAQNDYALATRWVHANDDFHDVFLDGSGVTRLANAARSERRVFHGQAAWSLGSGLDELYSLNVEQHRAIADAFAVRSPDVRHLVESHILDSGRLLEQALENAGYRSSRLADRVSWAVTG